MHTKSDMCRPELKKTLVLLVTLTMTIASGCSKSATPPGADIAAGVFEQAGFEFMRWEEGLAIMIWHNFLGDSGSFSESQESAFSTDPVYKLEGYAASGDGHRFEWTVHTRDGKAAQFWLDETVYDLSDGALFIVTMQEGKANVTQLDRNLSGVQPNYDSCVAFAQSDPDVARFIGDGPPSSAPSSTAMPPSTPTSHTSVYQDTAHGFEIRYSADFITMACPTQAIIDDPLLSLRLVDAPYYTGTNLLDACVTVGIDPNVADRSTCLAPQDSHEEYLGQQEINGALFSRISRGGVATGHIYDVTSYRTPHADACYEITLFLHHSDIGVYTPGTVSEFDKKGIMNRLEQVLYTFKFTDDETAADVSGWGTYTHHSFGVSFRYPAGWLPATAEGDGTRFAGEEGFFHIGAMGGGSLDEVVTSEAEHHLQPYGAQPVVASLLVAGQEARLILPADDQPAGMGDQAALIVRYPQPLDLSQQPSGYAYVVPGMGGGGSGTSTAPGLAGETYAFFVLWADKTHIRTIAQSVQFIDNATPGLTLTGTVLDVSLSARIITLQEPLQGFSVVALTKESALLSADGNTIALRDIQRGATIQASGQPGESQALIASQVRVLDTIPSQARQSLIIPQDAGRVRPAAGVSGAVRGNLAPGSHVQYKGG